MANANIAAADIRAALTWCLARADEAHQQKRKDLDGHYVAAARHLRGIRLAVRYNRHGRRQVLLGRDPVRGRLDVTPWLIEHVSAQHCILTGAPLNAAITDPRHPRPDGSYAWVILNPDQGEQRQALFPEAAMTMPK